MKQNPQMDKMKKEFKPMLCPVCGKLYFSGPNIQYYTIHPDEMKDYYKELNEYFNGKIQCSECGWFYDLEQISNPNLENESNKMSLNQYKKWYQDKIKENSKWEYYLDFVGEPTPHKCPVCGEYTFKDELSSDICPICGWEDAGFEDSPDEKPSEYMMSFNEHKKWFEVQRKENPNYKKYKK